MFPGEMVMSLHLEISRRYGCGPSLAIKTRKEINVWQDAGTISIGLYCTGAEPRRCMEMESKW